MLIDSSPSTTPLNIYIFVSAATNLQRQQHIEAFYIEGINQHQPYSSYTKACAAILEYTFTLRAESKLALQ